MASLRSYDARMWLTGDFYMVGGTRRWHPSTPSNTRSRRQGSVLQLQVIKRLSIDSIFPLGKLSHIAGSC